MEDKSNIVCGRNPVAEALRGNRTVEKIYLLRGPREGSVIKIAAMARQKGIPVIEADRRKLENICRSDTHQGVVAFVTDFAYTPVEQILASAKAEGQTPLILVIDGITDPHNLGAVIRTANACGVHGVILPKRNTCGLTSAVFKAAAGACEFVKIARVSNIATTLKLLKENNIWVYAADGAAARAQSIYQTDLRGPAALVLGDEGKGVSRIVAEESDFLVKIPMLGQITSLNLSVAGGVILYEILRQRGI